MCRADNCLEFCWSRSNPRLLNSEQSQRQQSAWWNIIETKSKFELKFFSFFGSISEATLATFVIIHCKTFIRPFLQATPAVVKPWSFRFSKIVESISLNLWMIFKWLYSAAICATLSPSVVFVSTSSAFVTVSKALADFQTVKELFRSKHLKSCLRLCQFWQLRWAISFLFDWRFLSIINFPITSYLVWLSCKVGVWSTDRFWTRAKTILLLLRLDASFLWTIWLCLTKKWACETLLTFKSWSNIPTFCCLSWLESYTKFICRFDFLEWIFILLPIEWCKLCTHNVVRHGFHL